MHVIYISKFLFIFFTIKSLLSLERYPLRSMAAQWKFELLCILWGFGAVTSCWVAELLLPIYSVFDEPTPFSYHYILKICHNSLTSLNLQLNSIKSEQPQLILLLDSVVDHVPFSQNCFPQIFTAWKYTPHILSTMWGTELWVRRAQQYPGASYFWEPKPLITMPGTQPWKKQAELKEKRLEPISGKWHFTTEEMKLYASYFQK